MTTEDYTTQTLDVFATRKTGVVRTEGGEYLQVPAHWTHLPSGDAAVTRRVKKAGPSWSVKEKKGRKMFSRGLYAPKETIDQELEARKAEVQTTSYKKKLNASRARAAKKQEEYVEDFGASVKAFLGFDNKFSEIEDALVEVVVAHATPVGSGTVARTKQIPIERRAEAAVIAWMRHQTTAYDTMHIPRVKGKRREVRRMLAERSREVLERYRKGEDGEWFTTCPLYKALKA